MTFELSTIMLVGAGYVALLFTLAWLAEKEILPTAITGHPIMYVMSLGVFACAWAFYGAIDLANEYGYGALAYYMGTGGLFIFAPLLLSPLFRLVRLYQLGSLADLLVFRFRSRGIGALTTLCMLAGVLPLLALQIQAVADTVHIMTSEVVLGDPDSNQPSNMAAIVFCIVVGSFSGVFGASRKEHRGLVTVLAFESILKVIALAAVGLFAVYGVFGSLPKLQWWLVLHPENIEALHTPIRPTAQHTLLLLFFSTAVAMPHVFHMGFRENDKLSTIKLASWGIPLYLLIMSLPIFPILWAGFEIGTDLGPEYFTLGVPLAAGNEGLSLLAYLGGLAAATGAMIVITLALTTMCLNHLLLPVLNPLGSRDFYGLLVWLRRAMITSILILAYSFYYLLESSQGLSNLAIIAFIETMQFLPGILAVLYWPRANRTGLLAGLSTGSLIWFVGLLIPMITNLRSLNLPIFELSINLGMEYWSDIAIWALAGNTVVFVIVSLLTKASEAEENSASICSIDSLNTPLRRELDVTSAVEVKERLAERLGSGLAADEVDRALEELQLPLDETRPYALRRLRDRLEANLAGLMGSALAYEMIDRLLPYQTTSAPVTEDIYFSETQLNQYRNHLSGLAAELDNMRRYHRQMLEDLPMGICSLGNDAEVVMWNKAMENMTMIPASDVTGSNIQSLPEPWRDLIKGFFEGNNQHLYKQQITLSGKPHWINLHKANIGDVLNQKQDGQVIMLEDLTETQRLESELVHSERLASVGRLAAGVAHEIGNPVTGIACLAQNLQHETEPDEITDTASQILTQTDRISTIVRTLVNFSHSGSPEKEHDPVDLFHCTEEAINLLKLHRSAGNIKYINNLEAGTMILGDDQQMIQVFINLIGNARDASPDNGHVWIDCEQEENRLKLHVTDEGCGIPRENLEHLFDPFFTTKEAGEGTGLGLALVYNIIEDHYGSIQVTSPFPEEGQTGTRFTITLARLKPSGEQA
jgi:PAS domain S-box-containing protein